MRAEASATRVASATLLLAASLTACASFVRPEGDGGWSADKRREEIAERVAAAGASTEPSAGAPASSADHSTTPERRSESGEEATLDLRTALERAAKGNRRIREAEGQLEIARERVFDARGRLLPQTTGSGRYTWYSDAQTTNVNLPSGLLPPGTVAPDVTIREKDFGVVNGTMSLPLDLSGEIRHALRAAQAGYRGEAARLWATRLEQELAVIRDYYNLLAAERLREVTEQTIALNREQVESASELFTHGRLTKNGLLVAQVALSNSERYLRARELAIDQARWELNQVIGEDVNAPTRIADVRSHPSLPNESEALAVAYAENPLLLSLVEEQQRLDETATALTRSRLPRFNAGGTIDYSSAQIVSPQTVGGGFVGFSWDLGTDTRREAQIAQATIEAEQNRIRVERQIRELEAAVRNAYEATQERLAALASAEAAVGQAEENLRIRRQQFDLGRAQSEDVLEAQALLSQQRATLATSLYEAQALRADLQRLMGRSLDEVLPDSGGR